MRGMKEYQNPSRIQNFSFAYILIFSLFFNFDTAPFKGGIVFNTNFETIGARWTPDSSNVFTGYTQPLATCRARNLNTIGLPPFSILEIEGLLSVLLTVSFRWLPSTELLRPSILQRQIQLPVEPQLCRKAV